MVFSFVCSFTFLFHFPIFLFIFRLKIIIIIGFLYFLKVRQLEMNVHRIVSIWSPLKRVDHSERRTSERLLVVK